jgi:cytochrome b561
MRSEGRMVEATGSKQRYGRVAQALHWITAILVLIAFLVGEGGPEQRIYSAERASQLTLHESLGLAVLIIVVARLAWRMVDRAPDEPPMPGWMTRSAVATHWILYLLLFAVPLTAIVGAWWEGHALTTYLGPIGPWFGGNGSSGHDFGAWIAELHTWLGDAILWVAGFHAAAALAHHFVLKDRVLLSMLPWK